ncbi:MAG: bifunctional 4-hydroxy-2-oxoglutarate aldolase/2-dehydro-3-deoxy-phosphogluconate aldolase [Flavobacteriia bacterium]|jgi:2-dehydro-3-deoxyphosphogluconate aldolase/(4S)-4-hydroxy-2-oxoglutarate aldolase
MQNNIEDILSRNSIIPVVTIHDFHQIDAVYDQLMKQGIKCIEITLRTDYAWEAIAEFKLKYGCEIKVGVGTVISNEQILKCKDLKVDFMVSPGLTTSLVQNLEHSEIPFIPGVATPSEIIRGMEIGWRFFKFFPANLFGGVDALKAYGSLFKDVKFCPTGGVNETNYKEYLALNNVISVGGSWVID